MENFIGQLKAQSCILVSSKMLVKWCGWGKDAKMKYGKRG